METFDNKNSNDNNNGSNSYNKHTFGNIFSLNTSLKNSYNGDKSTIYNYLSRNKIIAVVFFLVHLVGYNILGYLLVRIMASFTQDTNTLQMYATFFSEIIVVAFYIIFTLAVPQMRKSILNTRFAATSLLVIFTIVCYIFYYLGNNIISYITSLYPGNNQGGNNNQQLVIALMQSFPALMIITTTILAPIAEEFAYRLGLVSLFGENHKWLGIIISGVVFGLIHFNFFCSTMDEFILELVNLPSYVFAGAFFAYVYTRSENALPSISIHFINNMLACLLILYQYGA